MIKILEDRNGIKKAEILIISQNDDLISGKIIRNYFSDSKQELFKKFEETVNIQSFSLLDEIESIIESKRYKIKGEEYSIFDLQIWEMKTFSFRKDNKVNI